VGIEGHGVDEWIGGWVEGMGKRGWWEQRSRSSEVKWSLERRKKRRRKGKGW
jgi:hypothetical protein